MGFRVSGLGIRVYGFGIRARASRLWGFRVEGLGLTSVGFSRLGLRCGRMPGPDDEEMPKSAKRGDVGVWGVRSRWLVQV